MPDPLSIATAVAGLLQVTYKVLTGLWMFHEGVTVVNRTIENLEHDINGLARVLESMRDTFETITAEQGTGNVASHWKNVAQSIEDGNGILRQLESQVEEINKTTKFLDGPRKQLRLNLAENKIAAFRMHIQSYRDGLQLSLHTIILWNQVSYQRSADQVLPSLSDLHKEVRRMAREMNQRIEALQSMVTSKQDEDQVVAMNNLRDCVRSAASIVSSASTIINSQNGANSVTALPSSEFGDCFPVEQNVAIRRWMETRTVSEYDELGPCAAPQSIADVPDIDGSEESSDSDVDLENEITNVLLENGKQRLAAGDTKNAEKMFCKCLVRLSTIRGTKRNSKNTLRHIEVVDHLFRIYQKQQKWVEAQKMLAQKMAVKEHLIGKDDAEFLEDVVSLARLMQNKGDLVEAHLHARRALKGYKKLNYFDQVKTCLVLLIDLCQADDKEGDREAYTIMLAAMGSAGVPSDNPDVALPTHERTLQSAESVELSKRLHDVDVETGSEDSAGTLHVRSRNILMPAARAINTPSPLSSSELWKMREKEERYRKLEEQSEKRMHEMAHTWPKSSWSTAPQTRSSSSNVGSAGTPLPVSTPHTALGVAASVQHRHGGSLAAAAAAALASWAENEIQPSHYSYDGAGATRTEYWNAKYMDHDRFDLQNLAEQYEPDTLGHSESSSATRRVMDFFRRRGKDRSEL